MLSALLLACAMGWWSQAQSTLQVGYTLARLESGSGVPVGTAVFSYTNEDGVLVTEAGVSAVEPVVQGRIFVDEVGTQTGVALVNPDSSSQVVNLTLRDTAGVTVGEESLVLNPREHIARFVDELFDTTPGFRGSLTYSSSTGLGAITLRQSKNGFGEPLFTTLPVADLDAAPESDPVVFPHLAAGGGYRTQVVLINPTSTELSGQIRLVASDGTPLQVEWDGVPASEGTYQIAPNGVYLAELTSGDDVAVGFAELTPDVGISPSGSVIFQLWDGSNLVTEAGVGVTPETTAARISLDNVGRLTGLAIANPGTESAEVQLILQDRFGVEQERVTETLPGGQHLAQFAGEWFPTVNGGFTGIVEIQSTVPVVPITLQLTINSRGDLVLTTLPVSDSNRPSQASLAVFPQIVIGEGFATRLLFMNQDAARVEVEFFTSDGMVLLVPLGGETSSQFTFDFAANEGQQFYPGDTAEVASVSLRDPVTNEPTTKVTVNKGNVVRPRILVVDSTGKARPDIPLNLSSLDPTVATIDDSNRIEGIEEGFSTLTILAGDILASATIQVVGIESGAQGGFVTGIAQNPSGQVFLASREEHTILVAEQLTDTPQVYAGIRFEPGFKNDARSESMFQSPSYLALNPDGTLYVSEEHMIREVTPGLDGRVETLAGASTLGHADGEPTLVRFNTPQGLAIDDRGFLWVVDQGNHVIRRIDLVNHTVETVAGRPGEPGFADGTGSGALFDTPTGIAIEPETASEVLAREFSGDPPPPVQVIVADTGNGVIRRVTESGNVETIQVGGESTGVSAATVQALGTNTGAAKVRRLSGPDNISAVGLSESLRPIEFDAPVGVAITEGGVIHVAERDSGVIQTILPNGNVVVATETGTVQSTSDLLITADGSLLVAGRDAVKEIDVPPPTITGVTPDGISGDGGELVVVQGKNFTADAFIDLAGKSALDVRFLSTESVSFVTPALPVGSARLEVFTRGGSAETEISVVSTTDPFPEVFITNLTTGQAVSGVVTVHALATDNGTVRDVQLRIDGVTLGTDSRALYDFIWDTATASDGEHELSAVATDDAGNRASSVPVVVTVDNSGPDADTTPPTVSIDAPPEGASLSDIVTVEASASDDVGVIRVTFRLAGTTLGVDTTPPYRVKWDTTTASNGPHALTAIAIDGSDNSFTASVNVTIANTTVDTVRPEVSITTPVSGATVSGNSVRFEAVASDDAGVGSVRFLVDGTSIGTDTSAPYWVTWDTTTAVDGPHLLTAIATDSSENASTPAVANVDVSNDAGDATPPTVAIGTPTRGATVSGAALLISAEANDNVSVGAVQFYVDGILLGTDTTAPYSIQWDTTTADDGFHDLTAIAIDSSDLASPPAIVGVLVLNDAGDTTPPEVEIGSPNNGATVSGESVLVRFVVRDDVGVANVQLIVDGVAIETDTNAPYSVLWNTIGVKDGLHNLTALAIDTSDNSSVSNPVTVLVENEGGGSADRTPPNVTITTPAGGSTVSGDSVPIGVTATDDVGVASVRFLVDGVLIDKDTSAPYSTQWDTTGAADGVHQITAVAIDTSANESTSDAVNVTVSNQDLDTTAPLVSIDTPAAGATVMGDSVPIRVTATDDVGVARVRFLVDGLLLDTDTTAPYSANWDTTVATNGFHDLIAVATDSSGNTSNSDPVVVTISNEGGTSDVTEPTVTINRPTSGASVSGNSVLIGVTATDDVGVASVGFLVDNVLIDSDTSAPYSTRWDTRDVSNGLHQLTAMATDLSGNSAISPAVVVRVSNSDEDTTAPNVAITTPANGAPVSGDSVLIGVTATDDVGVASVRFLVDRALIATDTNAPYSTDWNTTSVTNGLHELLAVATDTSGNTSTSDAVTVRVENATPGITAIAPSDRGDSRGVQWDRRDRYRR